MPSIRGVYYQHPTTGEAGLWVLLPNGTVVGRTQAQLEAWVAKGGNTATKIERWIAAAVADYQAHHEERIPESQFFAGWTAGEIDAWKAAPPPYYRMDADNVVIATSVVSFEVMSLSPLRYQITISNGASDVQTIHR